MTTGLHRYQHLHRYQYQNQSHPPRHRAIRIPSSKFHSKPHRYHHRHHAFNQLHEHWLEVKRRLNKLSSSRTTVRPVLIPPVSASPFKNQSQQRKSEEKFVEFECNTGENIVEAVVWGSGELCIDAELHINGRVLLPNTNLPLRLHHPVLITIIPTNTNLLRVWYRTMSSSSNNINGGGTTRRHWCPRPDPSAIESLPPNQLATSDFYFAIIYNNSASPLWLSSVYRPLPSWSTLCNSWTAHSSNVVPTIIICGERNVGKSAFANYTSNRLTEIYNSVYYMEIDAGQPELGPPGLLGLYKLDKSSTLVGKPWTRSVKPVASHFIGAASSKVKPTVYTSCVQSLYQFYLSFSKTQQAPLIINTAGWVKGMGNFILLEIVKYIKPTNFVLIHNDSSSELFNISDLRVLTQTNLQLHHLSPPSSKAFSIYSKLTAAQIREVALTGYFEPEHEKHLIQHQKPQAVSFGCVSVELLQTISPSQLLYYLNGAIVGIELQELKENLSSPSNCMELRLNSLESKSLVNCHGLGIIRSIDKEQRMLWIVSPVKIENGRRIKIVGGEVWLSSAILSRRESSTNESSRPAADGTIPYLTYRVSSDVHGAQPWSSRSNLRRTHSPHYPPIL